MQNTVNYLKFLIINFLIFLLLACSSCMFQKKITQEEKCLLKDINSFNKNYGSKGWSLMNRKIEWTEEFKCNGILLKNSIIKNVYFQRVELKNAQIEDTTIQDVDFTERTDMSDSVFINVEFINCRMNTGTTFKGARFINCKFKNSVLEDTVLGNEYTNCTFENIEDKKSVRTYSSDVSKCKFIKCKLKRVYYKSKFNDVEFKDCDIDISIESIESKNINIIECLADISFEGKIENLLFKKLKSDNEKQKGIALKGDMKKVIILDCPGLFEIKHSSGILTDFSIINCNYPCTEFYNTKLTNLLIKGCTVSHLKYEKSELNGENRIENTVIWGNFYGKSRINNLTIENCTFEDYVDVVLTEFNNFKLKNNIYKDNIRHHAVRGDKYIESDTFPLKSITFPEDKY